MDSKGGDWLKFLFDISRGVLSLILNVFMLSKLKLVSDVYDLNLRKCLA